MHVNERDGERVATAALDAVSLVEERYPDALLLSANVTLIVLHKGQVRTVHANTQPMDD